MPRGRQSNDILPAPSLNILDTFSHSLYICGRSLFSPASPWGNGDGYLGFARFLGFMNGSRQAHFLLARLNRFPGCVSIGFTASASRTRGVNPNTKEEL